MKGPLQPKRFHYSTAGVKVRNVKTPTPFSSRKTVTPRRFLSSRPGRNLRILNSSSEVLIRWILQILNCLEFDYDTLTRAGTFAICQTLLQQPLEVADLELAVCV